MKATPSADSTPQILLEAMNLVDHGETTRAMRLLKQVPAEKKSPVARSYEAYCLASEIQLFKEALAICRQAVRQDPDNPLIYLNIARIFLTRNEERKALQALRRGIQLHPHPLLLRKMDALAPRRRPLFPFLSRTNPLNKYPGILLARL